MYDTSHNAEVLVFEGVRYEKANLSKVSRTPEKVSATKAKLKP